MQDRQHKIVMGIIPVADALAGTVYSDVISLRNYPEAEALLIKGAGATGTATITVEAVDNVSGDNPVAIPFHYQQVDGQTTSDEEGAMTAVTTAGFTTAALANEMYRIYIDASQLGALNKEFLRIKSVESVDDPVLAGLVFILKGGRIQGDITPTAIA